MKNGVLLSMVVAIASVSPADSARANTQNCCGNPIRWASSSVTLRWCSSSYAAGDAWITRMNEAAAAWTNLNESSASISITGPDASCNMNNQENEIWFNSGSNGTAIQATFLWYSGSGGCGTPPCCTGCTAPNILETDMVTYGQSGAISWYSAVPTGQSNLPGEVPLSFLVSTEHEFGHVLGITHSTNTGMLRMSANYPNGGWFHTGTTTVVPFGSDRADANTLWAATASYDDHYMINAQSSATGGVSIPLSRDPNNVTQTLYPRRVLGTLPGHQNNAVRAGEQVEYRICRGNLGNVTTGAPTINHYLSANTTWNSSDAVLTPAFSAAALGSRARECITSTRTIPVGTTTGAYYILSGNGTSGDAIVVQDRVVQVVL